MRRLMAAVAAAVVTSLTPGPALATDPAWQQIPCTSGAIDATELERIGPGDFLTLSGHLDCADPTVPDAAFAYAIYRPGNANGLVHELDLRPYPPVAPALFSDRKQVGGGGEFAICVVTDEKTRVGCVVVRRDQSGSVSAVPALPTDDPLVDRPIRFVPHDWWPAPVCGTCW